MNYEICCKEINDAFNGDKMTMSLKLNMNTVLNFGKHSGKTMQEVAYEDPEYIIWLDENTDHQVYQSVLEIAVKNNQLPEIN